MDKNKNKSENRLDQIVAAARTDEGYRDRALKLYPWICGRCSREFSGKNLSELTVHHRDHNHDNNPDDGSNWELLCLYCHDNEHQRQLENAGMIATPEDELQRPGVTHNPFAGLADLLKKE